MFNLTTSISGSLPVSISHSSFQETDNQETTILCPISKSNHYYYLQWGTIRCNFSKANNVTKENCGTFKIFRCHWLSSFKFFCDRPRITNIYIITRIVRVLWLAERRVCMRVCKHGCDVKMFWFSRANHASTNLKKVLSWKPRQVYIIYPFPRRLKLRKSLGTCCVTVNLSKCQHFPVCISWYKHSRGWENSWQLCKPLTSSRVC